MIHEDAAPLDVWKEYYSNEAPEEKCFNERNSCNNPSDYNSFYIYDCIFEYDHDGVAVVENENISIKFLHSNCIFKDCFRNGPGGAICFNCHGSIVQRQCCATKISIDNGVFGLFSYTSLVSETSNFNIIVDCSACLCESDSQTSGPFFADYGNISLSSSNVTENDGMIFVGFGSGYANGTGLITFTTIENNHAKDTMVVNHRDGDYLYDCCNIINNKAESPHNGAIAIIDGFLTVRNCTIRGNSDKCPTFYSSSEAYITILNCNLDNFSISQDETNYTASGIMNEEDFTQVANILALNCKCLIPNLNEPTEEITIQHIINFLLAISQQIAS